MILGVGIDQIEVARLARKENDELFLKKVFSKEEIAYCQGRGIPAQHFAARFAAKEAFLKAIGVGLNGGFDLADISILPDEAGKPVLVAADSVNAHLTQLEVQAVHVSLSHLKEIATAIVIIEK